MLMKRAVQDNAFFKCACRGLSGSGKSWFALNISIGLWDRLGRKNPIFYLDTENALSYILPHYEHLGVEIFELRSRSFRDLKQFWIEANAAKAITVIDSITHLNDDMTNTYLEDKHKSRLAVWDWMPLKKDWRKNVLEHIANDPIHLIVCGRLSDVFKPVEIDGSTVIAAVDSKMTAEKNTEYEPSLTVEMERFNLSEDEIRDRARAIKESKPVKDIQKAANYRLTIIKDRTNTMSGMYEFEPQQNRWVEPNNPIWQAISPHIEALKLGGEYKGMDTTRSSAGMFGKPDESYAEAERQKTILLEEVEGEIVRRFGQSKDDKAAKIDLVKAAFGTSSWTAIQGMTLDKVREGHAKIVLVQNGSTPAPSTIDKLKEEFAGEDVPTDNRAIINQIRPLYNKALVLRDDLSAAMNLSNYDAGADPANIRNEIKSNKATDWKTGIGRIIAWLEKGEK
jgi:hypothetical protein